MDGDTTFDITINHLFDREGYDSLAVDFTYQVIVLYTDPCPLFPFSFTLNTLYITKSVIDPFNYLDIPLDYTVDDEYSCYETNCGALYATLFYDKT